MYRTASDSSLSEEALGHEGITDLIVLMGYYTCVSMTMSFYSVPVSGGGRPRH